MSRIEENVITKIRQRAETGTVEHGDTMEREDFTLLQWLQHLQDEVMDAAVYIEKLMEMEGSK